MHSTLFSLYLEGGGDKNGMFPIEGIFGKEGIVGKGTLGRPGMEGIGGRTEGLGRFGIVGFGSDGIVGRPGIFDCRRRRAASHFSVLMEMAKRIKMQV